MSNPASEKILAAVNAAEESADRAESEYDSAASRLRSKASRSIDLFGGGVVNQVADIASESKRICDALYAAYQSLVKILDEVCRPLLKDNPDYYAVRAVKNMIKRLNDESEIENNFAASLNSQSLGGIASGRYIPMIENKMIQSFWEIKCDSWPGGAEIERQERAQRKVEEEAFKQKEAEALREKEEAAKRTVENWENEVKEIEHKRNEFIEKLLAAAKIEHLAQIKSKYESAIEKLNKEKAECERAKAEAEMKLESLGALKLSQKHALKKTIEEITKKIETISAGIASAEQEYNETLAQFDSWCAQERDRLRVEAIKMYPVPPRPRKNPYYIKDVDKASASELLKRDIVEGMEPDRLYTVEDLQDISACEGLSTTRISAMLTQLIKGGYVERVQEKRHTYFRLLDD